jgi:hypothetical protein
MKNHEFEVPEGHSDPAVMMGVTLIFCIFAVLGAMAWILRDLADRCV